MKEIGVNTDDIESEEMISLREIIHELECQVVALRREVGSSDKMRLSTIAADDSKVAFYTGFPSYDHLKACYNFLGPARDNLEYKDSVRIFYKSNKGQPRCLSPLHEFFLVLIRLRLGLLEQDIAYRFGISQPTVSRIFATWINFLFLQFKHILLWPPKELNC